MDAIKELYEEEIRKYQKQVGELKSRVSQAESVNGSLEQRVCQLQNLIEKAHLTNQDLNAAFEHLRQENLKLQTPNGASRATQAITEAEDDSALEMVQRQYINLAGESVNWVADKDRLTRRVKFLERECERYHRDNTTLGKQVRRLLLTLEEERGMIIRSARELECPNPRNASDVIDNNLVTFESIEELQAQNQKLLSLVKELSKNEEDREMQIENEDIKRLRAEQAELKSQLDTVSNDRDRALSALNTIFKERDLFRILLCKTRQVEHLTPEIFQRMVSIACSAGPALGGTQAIESTQDKDEHIASLQKMISKLELDLSNARDEAESARQRYENESHHKSELLEKAHLKIVAESERAETLRERNEVLEKNIATLSTEFDETRVKTQKLTFEFEQLGDKNKELAAELERERSLRKAELSTILSEIQNKCDARAELQLRLSNAEEYARDLESKLRNSALQTASANATLEQVHLRLSEAENRYQKALIELDRVRQESNAKTSMHEVNEMRNHIHELQRLRNLEREARLILSRDYNKVINQYLRLLNKRRHPLINMKTAANEQSPTSEKAMAIEEPVCSQQPMISEEPVCEKPIAIEEPVCSQQPLISEEPVREKPMAIEEPPCEEPISIEEPVCEKPIAIEEPVCSQQPLISEEPVCEKPIAIEEPPCEEPISIEEPVYSQQPMTSEEPTSSEQPMVTEEPKLEDTKPIILKRRNFT